MNWLKNLGRRIHSARPWSYTTIALALIIAGFAVVHFMPTRDLLYSVPAAEGKYVASTSRGPFHLPSCTWAKRIGQGNRVYYASREDAIAAGHVPCKVCKP